MRPMIPEQFLQDFTKKQIKSVIISICFFFFACFSAVLHFSSFLCTLLVFSKMKNPPLLRKLACFVYIFSVKIVCALFKRQIDCFAFCSYDTLTTAFSVIEARHYFHLYYNACDYPRKTVEGHA